MHTCLPNQNAKTFDRANKEGGGTGGREKGRKGGGRGEKGEREKGEWGREKGERRMENRRAGERLREKGENGEGEGRKGPPCTPLNRHIIRNGPTCTDDLTWEGFALNNKLRQYDVIGAGVNNLGLKITFLDRKQTF